MRRSIMGKKVTEAAMEERTAMMRAFSENSRAKRL